MAANKVKNCIRKIRYLRHPYLITRAILGPFEERESQKHSLRISEYERYAKPLYEGIEILTKIKESEIAKLLRELEHSSFLQHIKSCMK